VRKKNVKRRNEIEANKRLELEAKRLERNFSEKFPRIALPPCITLFRFPRLRETTYIDLFKRMWLVSANSADIVCSTLSAFIPFSSVLSHPSTRPN
jgi:hypothetical protein